MAARSAGRHDHRSLGPNRLFLNGGRARTRTVDLLRVKQILALQHLHEIRRILRFSNRLEPMLQAALYPQTHQSDRFLHSYCTVAMEDRSRIAEQGR